MTDTAITVVVDIASLAEVLPQHASHYTDLDAKPGERVRCTSCREPWSPTHHAAAVIAALIKRDDSTKSEGNQP